MRPMLKGHISAPHTVWKCTYRSFDRSLLGTAKTPSSADIRCERLSCRLNSVKASYSDTQNSERRAQFLTEAAVTITSEILPILLFVHFLSLRADTPAAQKASSPGAKYLRPSFALGRWQKAVSVALMVSKGGNSGGLHQYIKSGKNKHGLIKVC